MTTIVCLGAAGGMGATAARHLARLPGVSHLVLADRDGDGVSALVDAIRDDGGPAALRLSAAEVDVLDHAALVDVLRPAHLVVNCAGPFFRLGVPTLHAAIDAGTHYLDICDDPEPTLEMLALEDAASAAGVTAVVGMGASPGLSNLLARRCADRLDAVSSCFTAWPLDVPGPGQEGTTMDEGAETGEVSAAAIHLMQQISGTITVAEHGSLVERRPLAPVRLRYPGHGHGTAYTVGHPEPLTLTRSLAIADEAANLMLLRRTTAPYLHAVRDDLDDGRLDLGSAAAAVLRPTRARTVRAMVRSVRSAGHGSLPSFFALLHGTRDGVPHAVGSHLTSLPAGMDGATSIPAVLAVRQLLEHRPLPGVHPPEAVIDPERLLGDLIRHCATTVTSLDELAPIVVEPIG